MPLSNALRLLDFNVVSHCLVIALIISSFKAHDVPEGGCDPGWSMYNQTCYKIHPTRVRLSMALRICTYDDAQLASISNNYILQFLKGLVRPMDTDGFWVGLQAQNSRFTWYDTTDAGNQFWVTKGEYEKRGFHICFVFNGQRVALTDCMFAFGLICQREITQPDAKKCPKNTKHNGHLNLCLWVVDGIMTKSAAAESCLEHGGTMLDFHGLARLGAHKIEGFMLTNTRFWTTITWNDTTPVWFDPSSGVEKELDLSPFPLIDVAGTGASDESCTIVRYVFSNAYPVNLLKVNCDDTAFVMCKIAPEISESSDFTTPSLDTTLTTGESTNRVRDVTGLQYHLSSSEISAKLDCPHGYNWKEDHNTGYCYWETSYETARLTWEDARAYCQSYGGDLASFHSSQEERIGLSFQYGSISHPYWIGMKYDTDLDDFVWVDGSPVDYRNWARGQPDHKNLRMRCVQMDASKKEWIASYCGMLSWFVCKAPKQTNPKLPVLPTTKPLQPCLGSSSEGYFFDGYCYEAVNLQYDWHRARMNCQNKGGDLASVHSENEVDFLIKVVYEAKSLFGNRVWIGLNSFGLDDQLKWSDGTLLDFVHWNVNEPNNFLNQEKCCNMYVGNGLWNDENCNSAMPFICKLLNDTHSQTTTLAPVPTPAPGNCKKGWHTFKDNCYLPVGEKKEWANFSVAFQRCRERGGILTSIRDETEQVFLTYLMQSIKENVWIGLHDTIQSGIYFWLDNSPLTYTNWALGEPSLFGLQEDCVHLVYNSAETGCWKDEVCGKELPYICQAKKDRSVPSPWVSRSTRCIYPDGWLKHGFSCFQVFDENKIWLEALDTCESYSAQLVSVSDFGKQAIVKYLALKLNSSFWIGLQDNNHKSKWMNGWPMETSNWDTNEPNTFGSGNHCFVSSPSGYWKMLECNEKRPFICQINAEQPSPEDYKPKICPTTAFKSIVGDENSCYSIGELLEGFNSYFQCFIKGGNLVSIHSEDQVNALKDYLLPTNISSFFIGLSRNKKGGFAWADGTAVDFNYWAEGEPQETTDMCVEMKVPNLKWRVVSCRTKKNDVCAIKKKLNQSIPSAPSVEEGATASQYDDLQEELYTGIPVGGLVAIVLSVLIIAIALMVAVYFFTKPHTMKHFRLRPSHVTSFENELYEENVSLELKEEPTTSLVQE